ncbi:immunity 50 family protein [Streptomyces prunicolor]|uniref:Imm50 family immunity protein n=1 Tax=Streptomyces prunicolor TaxID=67348 RepID=UPI003865BB32|nr:immunity 50 family protein [Streptomyces prunicolor]
MTFDAFLVNREVLQSLYGKVPDLSEVRIRSINLNWRGPSVTLRVDLPCFPGSAPQEWIDEHMDTVQCQFRFLAVDTISLTAWDPPATAGIEMTPHGTERRMRVQADGHGVKFAFDCSDSITVGHVSAFRKQADGSDDEQHLFMSKIDSLRHNHLPAMDEKTFYER